MKSFTLSCILAAVSSAVPIKDAVIQEDAISQDVVLKNLSEKVADKVEEGEITVINGDKTDILADKVKEIAPAVEDKEGQILAVVEQIEEGFDEIAKINAEIEQE